MAVIKSFTDLQQSKKLAEILPLESADMIWVLANPDLPMIKAIAYEDSEKSKYYEILPAWSLASLLSVLPILERKGYQKAKPRLSYNVAINKWIVDSHVYTTDAYDNLVDACYEMILKLHELKML
jgi:hypothetical protein